MIHFMRRSQLQHSLLNESLNCRIKKYLMFVTTDIPIMFMWLVVTSLRIFHILWFITTCNQAKASHNYTCSFYASLSFLVTLYRQNVSPLPIALPIYLITTSSSISCCAELISLTVDDDDMMTIKKQITWWL